MSFPMYPQYKDSGVIWSKTAPKHWQVLPAKRGFFRRKELNIGMKCENRLSLTMHGVLPRSLDDLDGLQASEFETYQIFSKDDLVFKLIDLQNIKTSRVGLVHETGIMSPAYIRLEPKQDWVFPKFAYWFFTDLYKREVFNKLGEGVRQTLGVEDLIILPFFYPEINEQISIAKFLDHETQKIDKLISEQMRLIEVLKEKRQAVISQAVTKGLDPTVKMKDSGVDWLGQVPEHWEVLKFLRRVKIAEGQVDPTKEPYASMLLIAPNHIESNTGRLFEYETASEQDAVSGKYLCQKGNVVYSKIRPSLRKVCIAPEDCLCSADMYPLEAHSGLINKFLYWFILSEPFSAFAVLESDRVAMPKINRESLNEVFLAIPPLSEQLKMVSFLEQETIKIDNLVELQKFSISLLKERRSALITAAVTGQIDVRKIVPEPEAT